MVSGRSLNDRITACARFTRLPDSCHFASAYVCPAARFAIDSVRGSINPVGDKLYIADGVSLDGDALIPLRPSAPWPKHVCACLFAQSNQAIRVVPTDGV